MRTNFVRQFAATCSFAIVSLSLAAGNVVVYPTVDGMPISRKFQVKAQGKEVPVYEARIGHEDRRLRQYALNGDHSQVDFTYDIAGVASFDLLKGTAAIEVSVNEPVNEVKILPTSAGIQHKIVNGKIRFKVDRPQQVTIEVNGDYVRSLHIFVNPEVEDKPNPNDPNVIYFGPGMHDLHETVNVGDNQTLYIDGGAVLRPYAGNIALKGENIKVFGHGYIDFSVRDMYHRQSPINATGEDISIEGITILDSNSWTVVLRPCERVSIDNIKLLSHRPNSDGIDICGSSDVTIRNCFLRTWDDLVVVKTNGEDLPSATNILVEKCVLWNELAHALSLGAEIRKPIENVTFRDCDLIRDHGREWVFRIYHCDEAVIKNITFENIRVEECMKVGSLWINEAGWSNSKERGHIENVLIKDITIAQPPKKNIGIEFLGFDKDHAIKHVVIDNVSIAGKKLTREDIKTNEFVYDVEVK